MPLSLLALAASAFAIGTTEFVIMGLLPQVATDLHVTIPAAGLLVSGYAMGVVVGGPPMVLLTSRWPFKTSLLALMALFIVGNSLCALATSYSLLMTARVIASFCHGSFFGTAAVVAIRLAPPGRGARALGLMFAGLTLANVLGVPLGTLLGNALGWRSTFWAVVALGIIAFTAIAVLVPDLEAGPPPDPLREMRVLARPQLLLALGMTVFCFGGVFAVFTYIAPILQAAGVAPARVGTVLALFGLGSTMAMLIGGRLADWKLMPTILVFTIVLALFFVWFASGMRHGRSAVAGVFAIGLLGFLTGPALQNRSMQCAAEAPLLASTLNQSAFNLGNSGGAFLGSILLSHGSGYPAVSLAAAVVSGVGVLLTLVSMGLQRGSALSSAA